MDRGASVTSTLCKVAKGETDIEMYYRISTEELKERGTIKFMLTPHGYGNRVTHWHMRHIRSNILFIILGETGL